MLKEINFTSLIILALSIENCMAPPNRETAENENIHAVVHRLPQLFDYDDDFGAPLILFQEDLKDAEVQRELKRWIECRLKKEAIDREAEEFVQQITALQNAQADLIAKETEGEGDGKEQKDGEFVVVSFDEGEQERLDNSFRHMERVHDQLLPRRLAVDRELSELDMKFLFLSADVKEAFMAEAREDERKAILAKFKEDEKLDAEAMADLTRSIAELQADIEVLGKDDE
jgi:hypothetical protein